MSEEKHSIVVARQNGKATVLPSANVPLMRVSASKMPTKTEIPQTVTQGSKWAFWGNSDQLPKDIMCKIDAVPIAKAALKRKREMIFGKGLAYFRKNDIQDGDTEVKRAYIPEVEEFLQKNYVTTKYLGAAINEYLMFANSFTEMVFSRDRSKVTNLQLMTAPFCRLSKQNKRTFNIDYLLYHAKFVREYGAYPTDEEIRLIPLMRLFDEERFLQNLRGWKVAWHSYFPSPGKTYYAVPDWIGLVKEDGWLDVSANVPKIVSSMQKNQVSLKYQINIPMSYFTNRYPEWSNYTAEEREKKIREHDKKIEDYLTGSENWYKSITHYFTEDEITGKATGKVEIIAIDDKTKSGTWVPDANISDAQIVTGFGLHPSQVGLSTNNRNQGSGGSDQRESFNTAVLLQSLDQEIILEPLNWISKYNNWGVEFVFLHENHTTTNNQESGVISNPDAVTVTE